MNQFIEMAKAETTISEVMTNRTKVATDDLMAKFPEGVTLCEFDILNGKDKQTGEPKPYAVFAITENDHVFFNGGAILTNIALRWASAFDGDISKASGALRASGGCKVKMSKGKTKEGNNVTNVEIVEI